MIHRVTLYPVVERGVAILLAGLALVLVVAVFERLPIEGTSLAIDWQAIWAGVEGGQLHYGTAMHNPPWGLIPILPLGLLSFRASWGVLTAITIAILVLSVPFAQPKWMWIAAVGLLVTSFPSLRQIADGNLEGLVIAGVLLILHGYSRFNVWVMGLGILFATAKLQEVWLLLIVLGIGLLRTWPVRKWAQLGLFLAAVIVPSLAWKGGEWWAAMTGFPLRGSIMDSSLPATFDRAGLPFWALPVVWIAMLAGTLYIALKSGPHLSRVKATLLIAASMLLAPYAGGNSFLTVVALGIIPLFIARPKVGIVLIGLTDLPYLATQEMKFWWSAYYWAAMLFGVWVICAWHVWQAETNVNGTTTDIPRKQGDVYG